MFRKNNIQIMKQNLLHSTIKYEFQISTSKNKIILHALDSFYVSD